MKKFFVFSVTVLLALLPIARGQNLTVSTLTGNAGQTSVDGTGSGARFNNPWGVAVDGSGNVFVADTDSHCIRKVTSGGVVTVFAGAIGVSGTNDATGTIARFNSPTGVAIDALGTLYVTDTGNHTIRQITSLGVVTTLAGSPTLSGTANGSGPTARFNQPEGIALSGTTLYVADTLNHTIRAVTTAGSVSTYAGTVGTPGSNNATGTSATFNTPQGVAVDASGNVYVADTGNQLIRLIAAGAVVSTFAGVNGTIGSLDAANLSATFWDPTGIAVSGSTIYVTDSFNNTIRKIASGSVSTPVGAAGNLGSADGSGSTARFWQPQGLGIDISGNVYVADGGNGAIRKITGTTVSTLAGSASIGSADGTSATARFFFPSGVWIYSGPSANTYYVADTQNHTIRVVDQSGNVTTLAGSAGLSGTNDASGSSARFNGPQGICRDSSGNLFVADTGNHTIRKVTSGGAVSLFAGTPGTSGVADGTGTGAQFNSPGAITIDSSGNLYVADTWNHTIREVTSSGVVTTLAGVPGSFGDTDGTGANVGTNGARFYAPGGITVDSSGNVFVADTLNHTIRKITSGGVVSTIAGLGGSYGSADGTNSAARFFLPEGIVADNSGNLYVLDSGNHSIRKVASSGTNWIVTTVAGASGSTGTSDGAGSTARFFHPTGVAYSGGVLLAADSGNSTIRTATSVTGTPPSITGQPQSQTVVKGNNATFTVTANGTAPLGYQWYFQSVVIPGANSSTYTRSNVQTTDNGTYTVAVTNIAGSTTSGNATLTVIVPPSITTQPQSQTVNAGATATFSVAASGTTPMSYQWYFGASQISGATASNYSLTNAQAANIGSYSVIITNVAGTTSSSPATLSVTPAGPTITSQPQNQVVPQTSNATFSVVATGTTPFSYKWLFNGGAIGGATASSYTVVNVQPSNVGSYSVIVTNQVSATTSSSAALTISAVPVITAQPTNQLTFIGSNATFSVVALGGGLNYQWALNGTPISGATLASYTISPVQWSSAGSYSVVVTNAAGSATSSSALLIVQQVAQSFFEGFETYNLGSVDNNTSGGPNANPATDPWWALSTSVPKGGVTNASSGVTPHGGSQMLGVVNTATTIVQDYYNFLYRLNAGANYYGNFMCDWWFYDPYGATQSTATNMQEYVAISQAGPIPTNTDATNSFATYTQRMSLGMYNGNTGYDYTKYQARILGGTGGTFGSGNTWYNTATSRTVGWHHARVIVGIPNGTNSAPISMYIDNMTNTTVFSPTVANVGFDLIELNNEMSKSGYYGYYDDITFRADNDPWIIEQPQNATVYAGQATSLSTVAIGTSYQWLENGNPISGATTTTYSIPSASGPDAGTYTCAVTGTNGTINTSAATVSVLGAPTMNQQPVSQTVNQGQSAVFSASAIGSVPMYYQWQFNSSPISGATASTYTVNSATSADAGSYRVVITNSVGSATSSTAVLTVIIPPTITTQPASDNVLDGANVAFSVVASGTSPHYQWRFNGTPISNATNSSYQRANVQSSDAGSYSVVVSNSAGTVTSADAVLTIIAAQTVLSSITSNPDNSISMVWQVDAGTNYTLQYKTSLLDAQWNNLSNVTPASATLSIGDAPGADVQRTYQLASASNVSELGGFLRLTLLGNSDNFVSVPFGRPPAISALVSSVAGTVISVSGSPGWTPNQFVYVSGTQSNTYFVRFISGAAAGKVYTVTSNTANSLTVDPGNDSLTAVTANDAFAIEAYWTLGTVFPGGSGVNVSPTTGNRNTEILIPDLTSTGINLSASKIYFFNSGIWKQVGQGSASHADDILEPGVYFVVRHNVATNTILTTVGRVVSTPIAATIKAQSGSQQDNYVGLQRPTPVSLNDSGLISSGAFSPSPLPGSRTDELLTFDNTQVARNKSSNASYYYWQNAWRQVGGGTNDFGSAQIFQPGTGVIIRKGTNNVSPVWTNNAAWTQ